VTRQVNMREAKAVLPDRWLRRCVGLNLATTDGVFDAYADAGVSVLRC
jgi:hypothetical protein